MKVGPWFALVVLHVLFCSIAQPQSQKGRAGNAAQGSLTITVTVAPSVWLSAEPDGKQRIIVANAPDPRESFHHPKQSAVQFSLPMSPNQFEVKHEILTMEVLDRGKLVRHAVNVTTVVPR